MANLDISSAKKADNRLRFLVFGYIKSVQRANKTYLNVIPTEIFYLCILFLFSPEDQDLIGAQINLSEDKKIISKDGSAERGWKNTTYGRTVIQSTSKRIVTWKLKMGKFKKQNNIYIGVTSNPECQNKDYGGPSKGFYYAIGDGNLDRGCHNRVHDKDCRDCVKASSIYYESEDVVTMVLDLKDRRIKFGVSKDVSREKKKKVAFLDIKIDSNVSYRLAVSLRNPNDSVTILDFF